MNRGSCGIVVLVLVLVIVIVIDTREIGFMFHLLIQPIAFGISAVDLVLEGLSLAGLVFMTVYFLHAWPTIPAQVPARIGFSSQPNAWVSKNVYFLVLGLGWWIYMALSVVLFVTQRPFWPATNANFVAGMFELIKAPTMWLFAYLMFNAIKIGQGKAQGVGKGKIWMMLFLIASVMAYAFVVPRQIGH